MDKQFYRVIGGSTIGTIEDGYFIARNCYRAIPCKVSDCGTKVYDEHFRKFFHIESYDEAKSDENRLSFKMVYEQDLPELTDEQYDLLYKSSQVVLGVRMFPVIVEELNNG
jgi:hypothetical protein